MFKRNEINLNVIELPRKITINETLKLVSLFVRVFI